MIIFTDLHAHTFQDGAARMDLAIEFLDHILSKARAEQVPVLNCGDIVHAHGRVPTEVIIRLVEVFKKYSDVTVYAISGNHDQATKNYLSSVSVSFNTLLSLACPNYITFDFKSIQWSKFMFVGIPYLTDGIGFFDVVEQVPENLNMILVAHQTPSKLFNDFIPKQIDIEDPRLDRFSHIFLGHIHRHQELLPNRFMVGNPIWQDAGDTGDVKGYMQLFPDGSVVRHEYRTVLDEQSVQAFEERQKVLDVMKSETDLDERLYSSDFNQQFDGFCAVAGLAEQRINVGKQIINS